MSEALERQLSVLEQVRLRMHFLVCEWCARYFKQLNFLRSLLRQRASRPANEDAEPASLSSEARERIRKSLLQSDPEDR
jgi:hypothetical protein